MCDCKNDLCFQQNVCDYITKNYIIIIVPARLELYGIFLLLQSSRLLNSWLGFFRLNF